MPTQIPFEGQVLGAALTVVGLLISWGVWRRKGAAAGLRGVAWSLLPLAAGLMGMLTVLWGIVADLVRFFARLAFDPLVWAGVAVAGLAVVLWVVSGIMRARGAGGRRPKAADAGAPKAAQGPRTPQVEASPGTGGARPAKASEDDDFSDIEELLRRRGIG
ncbi:cellulose synthase [Marinactinospora thermotolerans]|uniref:Cellulose synthase n=1 Tax=Marinactinospora thermotolerans DSM 45154 TaxID=1122192 RepID=A0A1T4T6H3_9ACTN|nr:cellulose synthase [Marinactinospora thermotolerans]SKA36007.1 hypothetical protein SAMN02745673_04562 [Marinactinospora thermotolerans DSM 45154]